MFDLYKNYEKSNTKSFDENGYDEAEEVMKQEAVKRLEYELGISETEIKSTETSKEQAPEAKKESTPKKEKTKFAEDEKRKLQPQRARDRGRRIKVRRFAPLEGAPSVQGFYGPDPRLVEVAERYAKQNGIPFKRQSEYAKIDKERSARLTYDYFSNPFL